MQKKVSVIQNHKLGIHSDKIRADQGQIKPKSRLASRRSSKKGMDEFDLFTVKSKKANKTNWSVRFLGEVSRT